MPREMSSATSMPESAQSTNFSAVSSAPAVSAPTNTKGYNVIDAFVTDGLLNQRVELLVPLDYSNANTGTISVVANVTQKYEKSLHQQTLSSEVVFPQPSKPIAYCQGGPGFPCAVPLSNSSITGFLIDKGYQIIYYDQRGTGLSSPLEVGSLMDAVGGTETKNGENELSERLLKYILHFRADSIVQDMERVRIALLGENSKWLLLGQSYGGFCSFTYLSMFSKSLEAVLITGGVPPLGQTADKVYEQTYKRTTDRNVHYYRKYPQDIARVKEIVQFLLNNNVDLPNGGTLTAERFQQLGIRFGGTGGTDAIHQIVMEFSHALKSSGKPTYSVLSRIQDESSFDTNILYALFQEAIYFSGKGTTASNWAADRLRYSLENSNYVISSLLLDSEKPVYFTGEMVYKLMFDDFKELRKLKTLAYKLHEYTEWSTLYDEKVLANITFEDVPVVAATYFHDQYVDFDLTMEAKKVFAGNGNLRQYITSDFFHNGLRADPAKILGSLLQLLESEVD